MGKNMVLIGLTALAIVLLTSSINLAQQPTKPFKIGSVDIQKALNSCEAGKAAAAKLNKALEDAKRKYEAQGEALKKEQEALERQESVLNEEVFKEKIREFQAKARDWERFRKDVEADIRQQHNEIVDKISKELIEITEQVGKEGGFTLIVERSLVPYIDPTLDVTEEVIKRHNQKNAAKTGSPSPAR